MKRSIPILGALVLISAIATSCGHDLVQPNAPAQLDFVRVDEAVGLAADTCIDVSAVPGQGSRPLPTTVRVSATLGGTVNAGRYTVVIPPGALSSDTDITVRPMGDNKSVMCELLPHGIRFNAPVRLIMNMKGTFAEPADHLTIYWYNDRTGSWQDIGGTFDPTAMLLWTDLRHFSTYQGGRAGW